jgi:hypothetical protein
MPTLPGREEMRGRAIACLAQQEYPADWEVNLCINDDPQPTLGAKINLMVSQCDEDYIVLVDDDDYHSAGRVHRQVQPLIDEGCHFSGTSQIFYVDERNRAAFLYKGNGSWLGGLAFRRSAWEQVKFEDISQGPDNHWQREIRKLYWNTPCYVDLADPALFIATIHATNTCPKHTYGSNWTKVNYQEVAACAASMVGRSGSRDNRETYRAYRLLEQ